MSLIPKCVYQYSWPEIVSDHSPKNIHQNDPVKQKVFRRLSKDFAKKLQAHEKRLRVLPWNSSSEDAKLLLIIRDKLVRKPLAT